jgi:hypothetical protein
VRERRAQQIDIRARRQREHAAPDVDERALGLRVLDCAPQDDLRAEAFA